MTEIGSVSRLIQQAKTGDELAMGELHRRYWPRLVNLARQRLRKAPHLSRADEEDVVQEAFIGFYQTVKAQRVPDLANRHQLLALLTHIIACKSLNEMKHAMAQKRGGGLVRNGSPVLILAEDEQYSPLQEAILKDCYGCYVDSLPESVRPVAEMHLAGATNREIADELGCVERTIERKLAILREKWRLLADTSITESIDTVFRNDAAD